MFFLKNLQTNTLDFAYIKKGFIFLCRTQHSLYENKFYIKFCVSKIKISFKLSVKEGGHGCQICCPEIHLVFPLG